MIRCNNCGWFNPDTAKHCEMCDEELTGLPIENPVEQAAPQASVEEAPAPVHVPAEAPVKAPVEEAKPVAPAPANPMMETVRLNASEAPKKNAFSATVMDVGAVRTVGEPVHCPKCRYPVYGFAETCPNCGSSLKKIMQGTMMEPTSTTLKDAVPEKGPEAAPAQPSPIKGTVREMPVSGTPRRSPKATVREIPAALKEDVECWRLIPVESPDPEVIVMKPGEIISIGNRRYKFQK